MAMLVLGSFFVCPFFIWLLFANLTSRKQASENYGLERIHVYLQLIPLSLALVPLAYWSHGPDTWIVVALYFWPGSALASLGLYVVYMGGRYYRG